MIPGEIFTSFAGFQGIVSVNDFWFPIGFQELLQASLCEVLVLHGYAWIHWVARSCTTTAYRWLFRDSQLSLRTLWSAVIKSPKVVSSRYGFAIASAARSPCNFGPFTDLAISVFREMSIQIVLTQILTSLFSGLGRCFTTKISLNSCIHSGISESNGSPRSIVVSFLLDLGIWLAWLSSGCPDLSSTNSDTGTGEMSLLGASSLSRTWQIAYCGWRRWGWRRWWGMTLLFYRCPWEWWRCRGRTGQAWDHDGNKVLGVADIIRNPVLNEMWFLTIDPFIGIPVFIAKLSER